MNRRKPEELRLIAERTAEAALHVEPALQEALADAADIVQELRLWLERRDAVTQEKDDPVRVLPLEATADELREARGHQATRRGDDVFLPDFGSNAQVFPHVFLRSSLFSAGRAVQKANQKVLDGDASPVVKDLALATFNDLSVLLNGYELCQFDRRVYAACLDFYRDRPLAREHSDDYIGTSFSVLARKIGSKYSGILHRSIFASLLRLSHAQISVRQNFVTRSIPNLLTVSFEHVPTNDSEVTALHATAKVRLQIKESLSQLYGFGKWTAIQSTAVGYDGVLGWLANFYASHSRSQLLSVEKLRQISGYESDIRNFKTGLCSALDTLSLKEVPQGIRVARYHLTNDGKSIVVHRAGWAKK